MEQINKRRLNFISSEDFYFLAYSILLVLNCLGGAKKSLKDHRKFSFLIQFLADDRLLSVLDRTQEKSVANAVDRELLFMSYARSELHKREIFKILFSLEKKGLVRLERSDTAEILNVALCQASLPNGFFESDRFEKELVNAGRLRTLIPRLSALTLETLLDRLYRDRGVKVWAS